LGAAVTAGVQRRSTSAVVAVVIVEMSAAPQANTSRRRAGRGRFTSRVALVGLVVLFLGGAAWFARSRYRQLSLELDCKNNLRTLYEGARQNDDTLADAYSLSQWRQTVECSCAKRPFVYRPFDGAISQFGRRHGSRELYYLIAWCPSPCHGGHRVVLLENGAVQLLTEAAFQRTAGEGYLCENRSVMSE
jgi:hypothetical protein